MTVHRHPRTMLAATLMAAATSLVALPSCSGYWSAVMYGPNGRALDTFVGAMQLGPIRLDDGFAE